MTSIINGESGLSSRVKLNKVLGVTVNAQIGTVYTLVPDDDLKLVTLDNANPITLIVPAGLEAGFSVTISQLGEGAVTVVGSGTTVNAINDAHELPGRYATATLYSYETNTYLLTMTGMVAPVAAVVHQRASMFEAFGALTVASPIGASAVTSAGVFDSTGKLVRTLWSVEVDHPDRDNPVVAWDGTLEDQTVAPTGDYTIKVVSHNCTYTWEGVIGNTSVDHTNNIDYWEAGAPIVDMECAPDGKMWLTTEYHERLPTISYMDTAGDIQKMVYGAPISLRASYSNMRSVTTDGTITYFSNSEPGANYHFVGGITCATKTFVNFASGVSWGGFAGAALIEDATASGFVSSIAVQRGDVHLFVVRETQNRILSLNKTTGATVQNDTTTFVMPTIVESNPATPSQLWVCHEVSGVKRITKCAVSAGGVVTTTATTITSLVMPRSMAISPDGATLLVVDADTSQQVKAFNTSDGSAKTAFGTSGVFGEAGGYASNPVVSNTRWMFESRAIFGGGSGCIAFEPDGSWWLGDSGNYRHIHFSSGDSPAYVEHVQYMPSFYSCGVCKGDPTRVFVDFLEFSIDYDLALAPGNGSWTLVKNWGYPGTTEQYRRLKHVGVYSNGRTYATIVTAAPPDPLQWFELTDTGARATGVFANQNSYFDDVMNAHFTNWQGHGTVSSLFINPFGGFDASNNPTWTLPIGWTGPFTPYYTTEALPTSFPFFGTSSWDGTTAHNMRVEATENNVIPFADSVGDRGWTGTQYTYGINYLGGLDATTGAVKFNTYPSHGGLGVHPRGGSDNRFLLYPEVPFFAVGGGIGNAGGLLLYEPGESSIFYSHIGEGGWGNNQVNIWAHYHDSGLMLGRFGVAAPYFGATSLTRPDFWEGEEYPNYFTSFKGQAQMAGNSRWGGLTFVNDKFYIYQSDEWYHGGLHRWRVDGCDSIAISNHSVSWDSGDYVVPTPDPEDLLAGLPKHSGSVPNSSGGWTREPTANITTDFFNGPWMRLLTNQIVADTRKSPDLTLELVLSNTTACHAFHSIPRVGAGNWRIDAEVFLYAVNNSSLTLPPTGDNAVLQLQILDNTDKVIFSIHTWTNSTDDTGGCTVNGTNLMTPVTTGLKWKSYCEAVLPLVVEADVGAGTMDVTYGQFNGSRTVYEVGAAIGSPAKIQLKWASGSTGMKYCGASITELIYSE